MEKFVDPLYSILLLVGLGVVSFIFIWRFGIKMTQTKVVEDAQLEKIIDYLKTVENKINPLWHLNKGNEGHLQRRNEFWTTYMQTTAAVFIVVVIAVLLIAKVITPDAGLPILSAISGFVIAKSVSGSREGGDQGDST